MAEDLQISIVAESKGGTSIEADIGSSTDHAVFYPYADLQIGVL